MQDLSVVQNSMIADVFNFDGTQVRVVKIGSEPWFVASDISTALEHRDARDMVRNLDDDERGTHIVRTLGGDQQMLVINESGLYSAILKSRKPEALRFKKWVTSVLLPSVRRGEVVPVQKSSIDDRLVAMMEKQTSAFSESLSMISKIIDRMDGRVSVEISKDPVRREVAPEKVVAPKPSTVRMTNLAIGKKIGLLATETNDLLTDVGLQVFLGVVIKQRRKRLRI